MFMIDNAIIRKIQILVKQGRMSQRQIAKHTGVSRGTVQAVANGQRTEYSHSTSKSAVTWVVPSGQPERCPQCGGRVRMPCLACQIYESGSKSEFSQLNFI